MLDGHEDFIPVELGGIPHRLLQRLARQTRVHSQHVVERSSVGQPFQHDLHADAGALDDGLAVEDFGVADEVGIGLEHDRCILKSDQPQPLSGA